MAQVNRFRLPADRAGKMLAIGCASETPELGILRLLLSDKIQIGRGKVPSKLPARLATP